MSESEQSGAGRREVAYRLFAAEFDDADFSYSESDEERAPNYVITPTGARVNRLFVVGVLTEVETVSEDVLRARVVDPTGAFVLYAGQYQPDEQAFLDSVDVPTFVAVTGKARTFQPDDSDRVFTSVRPETVSEVDAATRDRWTVETAEQTVRRVGHMATARSLPERGGDLRDALEDRGVDEGLAAGIPLAIEHYGTTPAYLAALHELALDAARLVAGDVDEVESLSLAPGEGGDADLSGLVDADVDPTAVTAEDVTRAASDADTGAATTSADVTASSGDTADSRPEEVSDSSTTGSEPDVTDTPAAGSEPDVTDTPTAEGGDTRTGSEPDVTDTTAGEEAETAAEPGDGTSAAGEEPVDATTGAPDTPSGTADTAPAGQAATADADTAEDDGGDIGDFDPGEFELDEEEREEIEAEYGTEFQSGSEVPEPGEADIETPDPEPEVEQPDPTTDGETAGLEQSEPADASPEPDTATESESETATSGEPAGTEPAEGSGGETTAETAQPEAEDAPDEDVDLEAAAVDAMAELDEGSGADREQVVETLVDRHGVDRDAVADAIQEALMDGRCYEPDDGTLKPI